jgi:diguanylate cyclase (GGDEF)-like protein
MRRDGGAAEQRVIAGFDVVGELGAGSAATVLHVRRRPDGTPFAMKILDDGNADLAGLCREAALLASVDHPGLVGIHEVGEHEGRPYLVMDLVEGQTLTKLLDEGPLSPERAVEVALDVVEPLAAVHRTGLVHRDIKPDNIMIRPDGRAQLIDFGLAARESTDESDVTVGTLMYAPPEQSGVLRRSVDNRSDLYALGVVLFECLAGQAPFISADVGELLRLHAVAPPPDLRELVPGIPPAVAEAVATLLAKDPDDRYQRGEALAADLRGLAEPAIDAGGPLLGRTTELEQLASQWAAARRGAGSVWVVRGGPGSGKSRLLAEMLTRAEQDAAMVLRAAAVTDDPVPLAPLRRAIDEYLHGIPTGARAEAHGRLRTCAGDAAPLLAALTPSLANLLGPTTPVDDDRPDQFTTAVAGFLIALARAGGGLVLAVDDVHWLDAGTRRVLHEVAGQLDGAPLLLLLTSNADGDWINAAEVSLEPLPAPDVAALVQALLPGIQSDDPLLGLLITRSRGNPLVVHEYLRAIIDAGLLRPAWGRWILDEDGLDALALPQDALGLLLTRVHEMDERTRELLVTAAAVGMAFAPEVLAAVHATGLPDVLDDLGRGVERGLVEQRSGGAFAFVHAGIRDALLASLDESATANCHRDIAKALEALPDGPADRTYAIAHHYVAAGPAAAVERALPACLAAGELALRSYAPAEAVRFLSHAATLSDPAEPQLLASLGTALRQVGQFTEAAARLEQAVRAETDPLRRAEALVGLADVHRATWHLEDGLAVVTQGLSELDARVPANRFTAALTTAIMFVAAVLVQWTGIGRVKTDEHRRRCALIAALHEKASYLGALQQELGQVAIHVFRLVYWANRVGHGPQFIHAHAALATVNDAVGLHRLGDRAWARAHADPSNAEPAERTRADYFHAVADYSAGRDTGRSPFRVILEHGQWMDVASFAEAASAFILDTLAQGRNEEAAQWWSLAQRRLAASAGERTALYIVPPLLAAAGGQPVEAVAALRRIEADEAGQTGAGILTLRAAAWIFVLWEQNEYGASFDEAVAAYKAVCMAPNVLPRAYRVVLYHIAMGRIAQCRAASGAELSERVRAARTAVAAIAKGAREDVSRAWHRIARADLLIVTGQAREALRLLGADATVHTPDAPLLAFEAARVRARAWEALGGHEAARREAQVALALADEHRWPHRAGWITAEFDGVSQSPRSFDASATSRRTRTVAHSTGSTSVVTREVDRQRLHALQHLGAAASRVLDPEELARIALDEMIQLLHADRAFLFLGSDQLLPHLGRNSAGTDLTEFTGYSTSLVERVRVTREPLVITGTEEGAALGAQSVVLHDLRSIMIAPLVLDERLLGVVYLDSQVAKGIFTADDAGILGALAVHIATSLETARTAQLEISIQAAQRQRDLANQLREAFEAMSDTLEPRIVLDRLLQWAARLVPNMGVWLVAPHREGYAVFAPDGSREIIAADRPVPEALASRAPSAAVWTTLPLRSRSEDLGVLAIAADADSSQLAAALVAQGMTAYDNASLFVRVQELATVDELTGIANRRRFFELAERDLAEAGRHQRPVVGLMLDIDHFKHVNDTHGHPTGDDVIRTVAARLAREMRATDLLCRYGGEEFALLIPDTDEPGGRVLAERLRASIADEPVNTRSGPLSVTVSIGLAVTHPGREDLTALLADADRGLYRAKQAGRNRVADQAEALPSVVA